jgi:glycosyltransferase involved in cell wall biosynthesis
MEKRLKIALFDHSVKSSNAIGKCNLSILGALCEEHEFTVFAAEFENPRPEKIRWVRVPVLKWPPAFLYLSFHIVAPILYYWHRLWHREHFDLVQTVESILSFGDVAYPHFCNRAYLKRHWEKSNQTGVKSWVRWLDHKCRSLVEPWVYRRVEHIVVPSQGLHDELASEYPYTRGRIQVLHNPVEVERMRRPAEFDRETFREKLAIGREDLVLVFVALGHFERKGLPPLLSALAKISEPGLRLIVVGGRSGLISSYRADVEQMGLSGRVSFVGMQHDVRPYLWAADGFTLPSLYEVFPLVSLEAAAAGLPLIVSSVNGVVEFVSDGKNGILIDHTPEGVAGGLSRFLALTPEARRAMGQQAQKDVSQYDTSSFVTAWRQFYAERANHAGG